MTAVAYPGLSELVAAIVGAVVGSGATLLWEAVLRPRMERKSIAAALNAEVANVFLQVDSHLLPERRLPHVPSGFHTPTTIYAALASRLGELPPDVAFLLAGLYVNVEEANDLPRKYVELDRDRHLGGAHHVIAMQEQERMTARFYQLLESIRGGSQLVHTTLAEMAGRGVRIEVRRPGVP